MPSLTDTEMECPGCNSELWPGEADLGTLGATAHYRCPYCGWQWSDSHHEDEDYLYEVGKERING